jgi:hypothetical protein
MSGTPLSDWTRTPLYCVVQCRASVVAVGVVVAKGAAGPAVEAVAGGVGDADDGGAAVAPARGHEQPPAVGLADQFDVLPFRNLLVGRVVGRLVVVRVRQLVLVVPVDVGPLHRDGAAPEDRARGGGDRPRGDGEVRRDRGPDGGPALRGADGELALLEGVEQGVDPRLLVPVQKPQFHR